jgi:16S rRNA (cytidine1402-2'-O)-methyltransferase
MSILHIIPTPIGNLEDITLRALRLLKEVDLVLAEDTRTSKKLFSHYDVQTPLGSFHMHNEHKVLAKYIDRIKSGETFALISDAGTPAISDPGFLLVRECVKNKIEVDCLPGATAFVPALVNSGLPNEKFVFEGFLPVKKGRQTRLKLLADESRTMVFYESPHRVIKTISQFAEYFGEERKASVSREISKMFEETIRGTISELIEHFENKKPKGEFVIIVEGKK